MAMDVKHIAIENPVGVISSEIRKPDQTIQPYQFGHPESKRTCLWLKNLPRLEATEILPLPETGRWSNQTPSEQNRLAPGPDRARIRAENNGQEITRRPRSNPGFFALWHIER